MLISFLRPTIYGVLLLLAALLIFDTNIGFPLSTPDNTEIELAVSYMESRGLSEDGRMARHLLESRGFRRSLLFTGLARLSEAYQADMAYYAYTPILSRSRIFIGETFWLAGPIGHASVMVHELSHIRWHTDHFLGGASRSADEAAAYKRQYDTHQILGLMPYGVDGMVYWDMMAGVAAYVIPRHPEYAERPDVAYAVLILSHTDEAHPSTNYAEVLLYLSLAFVALAVGDRLGLHLACALLHRCHRTPLLYLKLWMLPIAMLAGALILSAYLVVLATAGTPALVEILTANVGILVLTLFLGTGLAGGFLSRSA